MAADQSMREERTKIEQILKAGSKAAKQGLANGLRGQAIFLRIQAAAGNVVSLVLPATGRTVAGITAELARGIANSFDSWAVELEKSAGKATSAPAAQQSGKRGDIEWDIMDKTDFLEYLKKIRPKNKERADELFAVFEKWKKEGFSDEDAVRKAFASQHLKEVDKRLDDLTYKGWDEEEFADKLEKGTLNPKEKEILDEVMKLRRIKGHALTQHQKGRKFFKTGRTEEAQERQDIQVVDAIPVEEPENNILEGEIVGEEPPPRIPPERQLEAGPVRGQIPAGRPPRRQRRQIPGRRRGELPPYEEGPVVPPVIPPPREQRQLPPPPEHAQLDGAHRILVDSEPMREVHIVIEMKREQPPIQPAEIAAFLGYQPPPPPWTAIQITALNNIMNLINAYTAAHFDDDAQRIEFLDNRLLIILAPLNIRNPRAVTRFIIDRTRVPYIPLDEIRQEELRAGRADPFLLRRPTGTTQNAPPGYTGPYGGIPPGPVAAGPPRHYTATYDRNRLDINQYTIFEVNLPPVLTPPNHPHAGPQPGKYRFTAPDFVTMRNTQRENNQLRETAEGQRAEFVRWDIYRGNPKGPREDIRAGGSGIQTDAQGNIIQDARGRGGIREREIRSRRTGVTIH